MIRVKHIWKAPVALLCVLLFIPLLSDVSRSQFLDIEEETQKVAEDPVIEAKPVRKLPVYVVRNIRAEQVQNIKGAIRITWDVDPASDEDYIVGRSTEVPFNKERALEAKSIKMTPPGAERFAIDSNLPPGNYYYVVLAKSKVINRDVELYPNVNYTTVPIVLEKSYSTVSEQRLPEQVALIHGLVVNRTQVLLTWKGVQSPGLMYNIYRGDAPLNTPEKIMAAERIAQLGSDKENFIDNNINKTGYYYYAVTTRDIKGDEDRKLVPDQSYTANGIFIALQTRSLVSNLKAGRFAGKSVRLTWDEAGASQRGKYLIYRDTSPIANSEKLALSEFVGSVNMGISEFIDEEPGKGAQYYAVLGKLEDGTFDNTLVEGVNYTTEPISTGEGFRPVSIRASLKNGSVRVSWKYKGESGNADYSLMRLSERINDPALLKKKDVISAVDLRSGKYVDDPPPGRHYYALLPHDDASWAGASLSGGVNITEKAVLVRRVETAQPDKEIPEIIVPEKTEQPSHKTVKSGLVDDILRETFFRERYNSAIQRLEGVVVSGGSDYDIARARLFIGRSYIEKGMYRRSLDYLLRRDVKGHFPREAHFWSSFAISRIKDR